MLNQAGSSEAGHLKVADDHFGPLQAWQRFLYRGEREDGEMRPKDPLDEVEHHDFVVDDDSGRFHGFVA